MIYLIVNAVKYDTDTGLYYLQSRYYDPVTHRFINADGQLNIGSMNGCNLFAYCENNPVNRVDPTGKCAICGIIGPCPPGTCEKELSINDFKNKDGSYSLYDNRRRDPDNFFHEQILSGEVSRPSLSLKDGEATLGSASVTLMTGGWEFEHVDLSLLDFGQAKVAAGYEDGELDITAMASAWAPSATVEIWDVKVTLSAHVGSIGGKINVGSGKFDVGAAFGIGAGLSVDW